MVTKFNEYTSKAQKNPKTIVVFTSNGKIVRPNPSYDPNKCAICGQRKGLFHACK